MWTATRIYQFRIGELKRFGFNLAPRKMLEGVEVPALITDPVESAKSLRGQAATILTSIRNFFNAASLEQILDLMGNSLSKHNKLAIIKTIDESCPEILLDLLKAYTNRRGRYNKDKALYLAIWEQRAQIKHFVLIQSFIGTALYDPEFVSSEPVRIDEKHYRTLGLEIGASREEIRRAYKELIYKYHPDKVDPNMYRSESDKAAIHQKLTEIAEAYAALTRYS